MCFEAYILVIVHRALITTAIILLIFSMFISSVGHFSIIRKAKVGNNPNAWQWKLVWKMIIRLYNIKPYVCFEEWLGLYVLPWKDDQDILVSDTRIYASPAPLAPATCEKLTCFFHLSAWFCLLLPLHKQANHMPGVSTCTCYFWPQMRPHGRVWALTF